MTGTLVVEQLHRLPSRPGVYLMKNAGGVILYVGKAVNLRNRVRSYFHAVHKLTPKLRRLVSQVAEIDFYITASEQEALILELNFIKQYHPRYNVRLKDDKTYPYLKITTQEAWPGVYVTRRLEDDGGRYFGPFANAGSVRRALKVAKGIFPFRTCTRNIKGNDQRACLQYYIGGCLAPCIGAVSSRDYTAVIRELALFLEGKQEKVMRELETKMRRASSAQEYEKAASYRDQIQAVRDVIEGQQAAASVSGDQDVIAFFQEGDQAYVQVFFIRRSKVIGREGFTLQGTTQEDPGRIMNGFIKQFYDSSPNIPPRLLLQYPLEDRPVIKAWLQEKRGGAVDIRVPRRGVKKQMVDTVAENARQGLEQQKIKHLAASPPLKTALDDLTESLRLQSPPRRIEGYDISNIQGTSAVGSMVVFEDGRSKPSHYRRFKIKTVTGANDYAMLGEMLRRRFKHASDGQGGGNWAVMPDLVLIDGGKGQVGAALSAMRETGTGAVPLIGLAKENEEIFLPGKSRPLVLPKSSAGLQLLQRVRDEAHRFALGYHTKIRQRRAFASVLDGIPGIGPKRKASLLRQFGSVAAIRDASVAELAAAAGMSLGQAKKVKEYL